MAAARGYRSVTTKTELRRLGFGTNQLLVPTLLVPIWTVTGDTFYQHRPDEPRLKKGKRLKYETPLGSRMVLDVPPSVRALLRDPAKPLFITEGSRKADSAVSLGLCCITLMGVWNWRGTNELGGKTALSDWELVALSERDVYVVFDSDVMTKLEVHGSLARLKAFLEVRGAKVKIIYLPSGNDGTKVGLDDYFAAGHTVDELLALATPELRRLPREERDNHDSRALPIIEVNNRKLSAITADTLKAIAQGNQNQLRFFQQNGAIVRLSLDGDGRRRADIFTADSARHDIDELADFISTTDRGERVVFPPVAVVKSVLLQPAYSLPKLRGVAGSPFFTRAGRLIAESGYHTDAELFLDLPADFVMLSVSPEPGGDDVVRARQFLLEPFRDFPFDDQASRVHAVALTLTPFARELYDGPTPLFAVDATKWGSGKGLVTTVASVIASGAAPSNTPMSGSDEELRKRLTATLLNSQPYMVLDNVRRRIDGESLALLLTTDIWHDRILGVSKMARIPVRVVSVVTGNNLRFSGEITRRTVLILNVTDLAKKRRSRAR